MAIRSMTELHNAMITYFPGLKFEYAKNGNFEKGKKLKGNYINPANAWVAIDVKKLICSYR